MKAPALIALLLMAASPALADDTTTVHNGSSTATVTQSGNPADTRKTVEQSPGHTRIDQTNGTNSSTIIQNGAGAAPAPGDVMPSPGGPTDDAMGGLDRDDDWTFGAPPKDKADVFGAIRREASPQSRQMLDRLMGEMKLPERDR